MAPILLTLIRLLQGLSLGGEFSGCIAYVVEHSPIEHRGLAGSSAFVSMCLGMLMGSLIATFMSSVLSPEDLRAWGWRVPFALGIVIGGLGLYIRLHLSESPVYVQARKANALSKTPLRDIFKHYPKEFLTAVGLYLTVTVPFYTVTIFVNSYMQKNLGFSVHESVLINSIVLTTMIIAMPISAYFSDIIGRKKILVVSCVSTLLLIYPIFWLLHLKTFQSALVSQVALALIVSTYMGPMPTTLVEMFPTKIRFTGVALSYNISAGLLGGTMPMIAMYFIHKYKCDHFVSYYIMFFAILSLIALKFYKETFKKHLIDHY
jgi:MHS family proline/betaine transporter-like MFS transporter